MVKEIRKLNWEYEKFSNWSESVIEGKKGFECLMCKHDNECHYCTAKLHKELEQIAVTIWHDGKLNYTFSSVNIAPPIKPCQIGGAIFYLKRHFARRLHGNRKIWRIDFGKLYLPHL